MNFFKRIGCSSSLLFLFEFLVLISISFSYQRLPASKEYENHLPSLRLVGVIVSKDTSSSIAILKNEKTGKTIILAIGDSISGLKLTHVFENRIILQEEGKTFQIFLGRSNFTQADEKFQKSPGEISTISQKNEPSIINPLNNQLTKREFIRSEIERKLEAEWSLIIKETRFVPNLVNGKVSGFKITKLPEKSILSEIGIYKNDIIKEINGIELNDISTLVVLYNKFKNDNRFEVSLERNGKLLRLLYILK